VARQEGDTVEGVTDIPGPWAQSPVAAKRWLGLQMRRRREAAGLTQAKVAGELRTVVAKVAYTERGVHSFKPRDLTEVLLPLYGVPEDEQEALLAACRHSRGRGWWQSYEEDVLPDWAMRYVGLEQGASSLRAWVALYPHGLVQTRRYAEALIGSDLARRDEEDIAAGIELRMERQAVLEREPHPLRAHLILDEGILHRAVGGRAVVAEQLDHILALAERPNVTIQVVPFAHGAHPEASNGFSLLSFGEPDDPGVVYIEGRGGGDYVEDPARVEDHSNVFDQLAQLALPPDGSTALIARRAEEHRR
jgi:transcriptional regulator with XRE-family HTH domain